MLLKLTHAALCTKSNKIGQEMAQNRKLNKNKTKTLFFNFLFDLVVDGQKIWILHMLNWKSF